MRTCVPLASANEPFAKEPPRDWIGGRCALAFAAMAAAGWLAPLECSAQHFYAGIGYGLEPPSNAAPADGDCPRVGPASRHGCEAGSAQAPFRVPGEVWVVPLLEPDTGLAAAPTEGIDDLAGQGAESELEDRVESVNPEERRSLSRLIAPSFHIPETGTPIGGSLSPFLGGGLGAVRTGTGEAPMSSPDAGPFVPGASQVGTAWMVTAGVTASLSPRTTVEFAWRYNHLTEVKTGRGSGRVEWRDRGRPIPTNLAPTGVESQSHGVRLSLRYGF